MSTVFKGIAIVLSRVVEDKKRIIICIYISHNAESHSMTMLGILRTEQNGVNGNRTENGVIQGVTSREVTMW